MTRAFRLPLSAPAVRALPFALLLALAALTGCGTPRPVAAPDEEAAAPAPPPEPSFDVTLTDDGPGRGLTPRRIVGYDPSMPGWTVEAAMGTLQFQPRRNRLQPDSLVLIITTSTPTLEHVVLTAPRASIETAFGEPEEEVTDAQGRISRVPAGTYFVMYRSGRQVRVVLTRRSVELMANGARVEWVDVFR